MDTKSVDQHIINALTEKGEDILYFFYLHASQDPIVKAKRSEIKAELDSTIFKNYTGLNYINNRKMWFAAAIENIKLNLLRDSITMDKINLTERLSLNGYELNNSCQFPNFIRSVLERIPKDFELDTSQAWRSLKLRQHQEVSRQYAVNVPILRKKIVVNDKLLTVNNDVGKEAGLSLPVKQRAPISPYRGALLYHDMGTGKTLTGVHLAVGWIDEYRLPMLKETINYTTDKSTPIYTHQRKGKVVFMFLKRLESTWSSSIYRYLNEAYDLENYFINYFYLTTSAESLAISTELKRLYNSDQINLIKGFKETIVKNGQFNAIKHYVIESFIKDHIVFLFADPNGVEDRIKNMPLEHNLLLIDEIHNVVSYIHGALLAGPGRAPGKVGAAVYDWFMSSFDSKIIGLSGTPIINKPSELLVLANILRGKMIIRGDGYESLFSLDLDKIQQLIFDENNEIINPELLSRRLTGLISRKIRDASPDYPVSFWSSNLPWNGDEVPWAREKLKLFNPTTDSIISLSIGNIRRINIPLSERQYVAYQKVRERPTNFSEERKGGPGGAFNTLLGMASYPLDASLLYEIKLGSGVGTSPLTKCNPKEILRILKAHLTSQYSLFVDKTYISGIDRSTLLQTAQDAEKFANYICNCLSKVDSELYNPVINAILSSEKDGSNLHEDSVLKALELYKGVHTERQFLVNRFVYNKATVIDDAPKIAKMLETILDPSNRDLHFIYAHTIIYGAFHIEGYLQANGYELYLFDVGQLTDPNMIKMRAISEISRLQTEVANGKKFYVKYAKNYQFIRNGNAVYGPDIDDKKLIETIDYIFNSDANKEGQLIKVLIGTKKAKEGLDLRHVRQVYILDPWWNMVSVEQAMGRAIRFLSHYRIKEGGSSDGFPDFKDRYVKIDLLIGVFSGDQIGRLRGGGSNNQTVTVDERALTTALNKLDTSNKIEDLLNKSAFDCGLYGTKQIPCVNRFETSETGTSYVSSIQNEPIDIEYNLTRVLKENKYFKVLVEGQEYFRSETIEDIEVEFETEGGIKTQKAELILYENYMDGGILIPAYAIVTLESKSGNAEYLQIKYPAFKIA